MSATYTCPRCFYAGAAAPAVRFCPRCGLDDVVGAAAESAPMELMVAGRAYRVLDRIAVGSVCSIYRCQFAAGPDGRQVEGVFKIARDSRTNDLVANEAAVLRRLHALDGEGRFAPFLPAVQESFALGDGGPADPSRGASPGTSGTPTGRQANVLRMHEEVRSPDELYTLAEVRREYPAGLDARDAAWVWRRLLSVLGFAHASGVAHAAVLPVHVLIEPVGHKLLLIDWCCATGAAPGAARRSVRDREPVTFITGGYAAWYGRAGLHRPATPGLDIALAARCTIDLLGGEATRAEFPPALDPALVRYFQRCLAVPATESEGGSTTTAWKLLHDFDRLIQALWGPRTYRPLAMPPRPPRLNS